MKHKTINFIKKQWLSLWIIITAAALFTFIASAEALKTLSPMKRVLVSKSGHGVLFSSNLLTDLVEKTQGSEKTAAYQAVFKEAGSLDVDLYLWNYNILDDTTRYPKDINYELRARLTDTEGKVLDSDDLTAIGAHTITITPTDPSGTSLVLSASNPSGKLENLKLEASDTNSDSNEYSIEFSTGWDLERDTDICVEILAVPTLDNDGHAYTDISTIGRIIGLRKTPETHTNGWSAAIAEMTVTSRPTEFDAYNLVLSGSGSADITVSWKVDKLGVNPYFYDNTNDTNGVSKNVYGFDFAGGEIEDNGVVDGWHTIIVHADTSKASQLNRNRYILQVYKLGKDNDKNVPGDWSFFVNNGSPSGGSPWLTVTVS